MKVKFWNYGIYSSDNYGVHSLAFEDANGNCYWFSYNTLVAFQKCGDKRYVHTNDWGTTTGKHLNFINKNKKDRLDRETFNKKLQEFLAQENKIMTDYKTKKTTSKR